MPSTFFLPPLPPPFSANPSSSFLRRLIDHFSLLLVLLPSLLSFLSLLLAPYFFLLLRLCGSSYPHCAAPVNPPPRQPALFARVYITRTVDSPYITFSISLVRSLLDFCSSCSFSLFFFLFLCTFVLLFLVLREPRSRLIFCRRNLSAAISAQPASQINDIGYLNGCPKFRVEHRGIGWRCVCDVLVEFDFLVFDGRVLKRFILFSFEYVIIRVSVKFWCFEISYRRVRIHNGFDILLLKKWEDS